MSVIEDALRRAELQGRSTPPRSVGTAAAVVRRPVLTPSSGKSAHHAAKPRTVPQIAQRSADSGKPKPSAVTAPRRWWGATMLIAVVMSIVFGRLMLVALTELPPSPSMIVAGGLDLAPLNAVPEAMTTGSMSPESAASPISDIAIDESIAAHDSAGASASVETPASPAVRHPVAIDATDSPSSERVRDRTPKVTRRLVDPVAEDAKDAPLIESVNRRFHVAGVMVSSGKRLAVINDVVVGLGDRVDGAIVRAIDARGVVIEVDGGKHHLPVTVRARN